MLPRISVSPFISYGKNTSYEFYSLKSNDYVRYVAHYAVCSGGFLFIRGYFSSSMKIDLLKTSICNVISVTSDNNKTVHLSYVK